MDAKIACERILIRTDRWITIELEFERFLLFWFVKLLYDGGIISTARSQSSI